MTKGNVEKKDSFFKIMGPSILTAWNALLIFYLSLLANGKSLPFPKKFSIPINYQIAIVSALLFLFLILLFRSITKFLRRHYGSKQEYDRMAVVSQRDMLEWDGYRISIEKKEYFFNFRCYPENRLNVYRTDGPFCVGKDRSGCGTELRVETTYFGRYKYTCDVCGKKHKSSLSKFTLRKRAERIFVSNLKRHLKN